MNIDALLSQIKDDAKALGFSSFGISHTSLKEAGQKHQAWFESIDVGDMDYMQRNAHLRANPSELHPNTVSILSFTLPYWPEKSSNALEQLNRAEHGYVSRYALGRDYHKVFKKKLEQMAARIRETVGDFSYRVFVDSAPVMEQTIAEQAGLGWVGKNTLLLNAKSGSFFFLGEIFLDFKLPIADTQAKNSCGSCTQCLDFCPTQAFRNPYELEVTKCISYLTIEHHGSIPEELRPLIGNRIYGCDDCQLVCPWNKFALLSDNADFSPRNQLDELSLIEAIRWNESEFLDKMAGSPIRRIGHAKWQRNVAVAIGNQKASEALIDALNKAYPLASELAQEHIQWAIEQLKNPANIPEAKTPKRYYVPVANVLKS